MDDVDLFALSGMSSGSDAMFRRRRRMLNEARRMIERGGLEGFNIRELSRRADVASRTIYNAFGSKENVIALAIRTYFDSFQEHVVYASPADSFEGALERLVTSTLRNHEIPQYMRAVAALYFSPTLHSEIRAVLLDIGGHSWLPWLRRMRVQRRIEKWIGLEELTLDISNAQFATVHEWGLGTLTDEQFFNRIVGVALLLLAGATRGNARTEVLGAMEDFREDGPLRKRLVAQSRERLAAMEGRRGSEHI